MRPPLFSFSIFVQCVERVGDRRTDTFGMRDLHRELVLRESAASRAGMASAAAPALTNMRRLNAELIRPISSSRYDVASAIVDLRYGTIPV